MKSTNWKLERISWNEKSMMEYVNQTVLLPFEVFLPCFLVFERVALPNGQQQNQVY